MTLITPSPVVPITMEANSIMANRVGNSPAFITELDWLSTIEILCLIPEMNFFSPRHACPVFTAFVAVLARAAVVHSIPLPQSTLPAGDGLPAAVQSATTKLQQTWGNDLASASLPFPPVRLLPAGSDIKTVCSSDISPRRPARTASYCASQREVLLDQDLLAPSFEKRGSAAVSYWIAIALAERMTTPAERSAPLSAMGNLEANCLAGVLLGASAKQRSTNGDMNLINIARGAYGNSFASSMGTSAQRAYALLSGFGATASSCSTTEMERLVQGEVPDPALLRQIEQLPSPDRGFNSLMAVINSQCRPLRGKPCPRLLPVRQSISH